MWDYHEPTTTATATTTTADETTADAAAHELSEVESFLALLVGGTPVKDLTDPPTGNISARRTADVEALEALLVKYYKHAQRDRFQVLRLALQLDVPLYGWIKQSGILRDMATPEDPPHYHYTGSNVMVKFFLKIPSGFQLTWLELCVLLSCVGENWMHEVVPHVTLHIKPTQEEYGQGMTLLEKWLVPFHSTLESLHLKVSDLLLDVMPQHYLRYVAEHTEDKEILHSMMTTSPSGDKDVLGTIVARALSTDLEQKLQTQNARLEEKLDAQARIIAEQAEQMRMQQAMIADQAKLVAEMMAAQDKRINQLTHGLVDVKAKQEASDGTSWDDVAAYQPQPAPSLPSVASRSSVGAGVDVTNSNSSGQGGSEYTANTNSTAVSGSPPKPREATGRMQEVNNIEHVQKT